MSTENEVVEGEEGEVQEGQQEHQEDQFEKAAREQGWRPKEEWDGPEGKWIDAKTFVERGDHILPILRANSKKLKDELLTANKELSTLRESLAASNKAIAALRKGYNESTKREVELALEDLKEKYKAAREVGDVDLELEARDGIDALKEKVKKIESDNEEATPFEKKGNQEPPKLSPEFLAWQAENKWYGNEANPEDKARSEHLMRVANKLRGEGDTTVGRPFMDKCMAILEEQERGYSKPRSKVEGGGERRGNSGKGGRAFDNLPKEAKDACHADTENFVGPKKLYKTVQEWENRYAELYNQG